MIDSNHLKAWIALSGLLSCGSARADVFNVSTGQELQNALTTAAINGVSDTIRLGAGYYIGNFNFNSAEAFDLNLQAAAGVSREAVTLDGDNVGRCLNVSSSAAANISVTGITFLRKCGNNTLGALRISTTTPADVLVENCRFLGASGARGIGVEITSCRDATIRNCVIHRDGNSEGDGVSLSGATRAVLIGRNTVTGDTATIGRGIGISLASGGTTVTISDNIVIGNREIDNGSGGGGVGIWVSGETAVYLSKNTISENVTGYDGSGGGLLVSGAGSITLTENTITKCTGRPGAYGGGACIVDCSMVELTRNTISQNQTSPAYGYYARSGRGGGVHIGNGGTVRLTENVIEDNLVSGFSYWGDSMGVGVSIVGPWGAASEVTLNRNAVNRNRSYDEGGGVGASVVQYSNYDASTMTVTGNAFKENSAVGEGGGFVFSQNGSGSNSMTFVGNIVSGNLSRGNGGGGCVRQAAPGSMLVEGNRVTGNTSQGGNAGGLLLEGPTITVRNNSIAENGAQSSARSGAGLWVRPTSRLDLINNTITANDATGDGGGLRLVLDGTSEIVNAFNNIIFDNVAGGSGDDVYISGSGARTEFAHNNASGLAGVWHVFANNSDLAPSFADGPNGDYHLTADSPCLNMGTNGVPGMPSVDLDGDPRIAGGTVDMGAFEFFNTDLHPADVNTNWIIEAGEFTAYSEAWRGDQGWGASSNSISADYVTRAGYLKENGGNYYNDGAGRPLRWKPGTAP